MNSIRRKLLLMLIGAMSAVMLLGAAATYTAVREEANTLFDYHLEQIALSMRDQSFQGSTQALVGERNFDFVIRVWDRDGLSTYSSRRHRVLPEIARLGYATEETSEGAWRVFTLQHLDQTIAVAQPLQVRSALAATAALRTLIPYGVLLPLFAALIWLVVIRELRPLDDLARSVGARTPDDLHPFIAGGIPAELRPLVRSLNDLLARLQAALSAQRDFIADAAHELRTPLTALQLQTQLVERATGDAQRTAALGDLKQGLSRTIHTVHQLLTLARQEPGAAEPELAPVALADLVRQVLADHATLAAAKNIDLGATAIDPAARVTGDGDALSTLLANLVSNAVRFTPSAGRIDVSCGVADQRPFLEVADSGPGIPAAERGRVFDRFYRHGGEESPGSGLGLAIVRTIANRHAATIRLGDAPAGGLLVRIDFPVAVPEA
jgi:two-component system OmpR family sensor kinase